MSAILVAACSIYDPSLLTSVRSSASSGGAETGGLPGKTESTGGTSSLGGAGSANGGSSRGGSTGGTEGGSTGGSTAAGASTSGTGGESGGAPASGGSLSRGGSSPSGGSGGSATSGGTASGGVVSTQGGASSGGKSSGGSGGAGGGSSCAGKVFQGLCWYLGPRGESCDATCAAYGGVAPGAEAFVGTTAQGGSLTECRQLLVLLGVPTAPFLGTRDDVGLGCHLYDEDPYWLDAPDFTTDASVPEARLVCACR